jgi:hypothetical protein
MISSKTFEWKKEPDHPLADCYQWALQHSTQKTSEDSDDVVFTPMLVVVQQFGENRPNTPTMRRFTALTPSTFWDAYTKTSRDDGHRHYDEVIGLGPVAAYADFDFPYSDAEAQRKFKKSGQAELLSSLGFASVDKLCAALESSAAGVIEEVVAFHLREHGVAVKPFITISHRAGDKWSMHVVFSGSMWANYLHLRGYMTQVKKRRQATDPLVGMYMDMQVYGRFRCMRMYRSSKLKDPTRSLLRLGEKRDAPIDMAAMTASMITLFSVTPPADSDDVPADGDEPRAAAVPQEPMLVTTAFLHRFPRFIKALGLRPLTCSEVDTDTLMSLSLDRQQWDPSALAVLDDDDADERAQLNEIALLKAPTDPSTVLTQEFRKLFRQRFAGYKPYKFEWREREGQVKIQCNVRQCGIFRNQHAGNHIFIEIDVMRSVWHQGCHAERCANRYTNWQPLPDSLTRLCVAFAPRWLQRQQFPALKHAIRMSENTSEEHQ